MGKKELSPGEYISNKTKRKKGAGLGNRFFMVQKILKEKQLKDGRVMCYVSWKGYNQKYNSWVFKKTVMPLE